MGITGYSRRSAFTLGLHREELMLIFNPSLVRRRPITEDKHPSVECNVMWIFNAVASS